MFAGPPGGIGRGSADREEMERQASKAVKNDMIKLIVYATLIEIGERNI